MSVIRLKKTDILAECGIDTTIHRFAVTAIGL